MTAKKRKPNEQEKEKLDSTKIPLVTMKAAEKAYERGDEAEARRLLGFLYDASKLRRKQ